MNELESSAVFEAAARATINERCAAAFLHDVRGSMQALFSAFELLGRSARSGGGNPVRVEKACDLAKRAITQHEKSTMEILGLLTLQHAEAAIVDLGSLVREAAHFLRNDAATKGVALKVDIAAEVSIRIVRARMQTMLVGLLTAAIDHSPTDCEFVLEVRRLGDEVVATLPSAGAFDVGSLETTPAAAHFRSRDLTLLFSRHLMVASGGRVELDGSGTTGTVRLYFPTAV